MNTFSLECNTCIRPCTGVVLDTNWPVQHLYIYIYIYIYILLIKLFKNKSGSNFINNLLSATYFGFVNHIQAEYIIAVRTARRCSKKDRTFAVKTYSFYSILSTVPFKVVPSTGDTPFPFLPLLECSWNAFSVMARSSLIAFS